MTVFVLVIIIFQVFKRPLKSWKVHFWCVRNEKLHCKNVPIIFALSVFKKHFKNGGRMFIGFDFGGFTELVDASNLKQKHKSVKNAYVTP